MQHLAVAATRRIGLDLVRALAIALVLLSHIGVFSVAWSGGPIPHWLMMSGFFGVELFFALSGFLIGGLLLDLIERDASIGGWARFMARRWLRTLPVYWVWIGVLAVVWRPPAHRLQHILSYGTATQNLLWPMPRDAWFAVSWSLTVEEWFYLLFSAIVLGGVAYLGRPRVVLWSAIGLFIVVPVWLRSHVPLAADWDTEIRKVALLRLDAIAYGVAAVALWRRNHLLFARPLLALGVGVVLIGVVGSEATFWPDEPVPWLRVASLSLAPLGFALCLPAMARLRWLPGERLIRQTASSSYALYIVHYSVLEAMGGLRVTPTIRAALAVIVILGVAEALHRWVEAPVMVRRPAQFVSRSPETPLPD
jgi:peptidoglycan/LPS O-acetylase OafA/YrhL